MGLKVTTGESFTDLIIRIENIKIDCANALRIEVADREEIDQFEEMLNVAIEFLEDYET